MTIDLRTALHVAAPQPQRPFDPRPLRRRAQQIRRRRRGLAAAGAALVLAPAAVTLSPYLTPPGTVLSTPVDETVDLTVFLSDRMSDAARVDLEERLRAEPAVVSVRFESRQDAYEQFARQHADEPELLETVTPDMLPEAFRVQVRDRDAALKLRQRLDDEPGVDAARLPANDPPEAGDEPGF